VGNPEQISAMMEQVKSDFGGLDILVNNAGILQDRTIKKMTLEEWETVLRVNLTGAFNCIQQAIPILRPGGRIVNVSSVSGQLGFFGQANYSASKAGLMALTKTAARELAKQNITVNAIAPGFIDTEMTSTLTDQQREEIMKIVALGRTGKPEDIAPAAVFLASDEAAYITGHVLTVDGGLVMY
jgi:3-oxoacyl-[acyl-carrier protein] reductase